MTKTVNLIHAEVFNRHRPEFAKLIPYGFIQSQDDGYFYLYRQNILQDDFCVEVQVNKDGSHTSQVIDLLTNDEYINVSIPSVQGEFVNSVRSAYKEVLSDIVENCFTPTHFANAQTNRLAEFLLTEFESKPDEPFAQHKKHKDTVVFRNPDNQKWYALVTQVTKSTLEPNLPAPESKQLVEIINIKVDSTQIPELHKQAGIYPAYHMNKKHWVSIVLDDSVNDEQLFNLVCKSRAFTLKNTTSRTKKPTEVRTQIKHWVVPANPSYYDVIKVFKTKDVIYWYQGANFIVGDVVYIYLGKPYSAILYACKVIKVNIKSDKLNKKGKPIKRMNLQLIKTFEQDKFTFEKLKALGLTSIRGARGVPDAVVKAIG